MTLCLRSSSISACFRTASVATGTYCRGPHQSATYNRRRPRFGPGLGSPAPSEIAAPSGMGTGQDWGPHHPGFRRLPRKRPQDTRSAGNPRKHGTHRLGPLAVRSNPRLGPQDQRDGRGHSRTASRPISTRSPIRALKIPAPNGNLAVAGFSWGGGNSFRFATNRPDLKAAFVFYGNGPEAPEAIARINAPVYGFYGGNDARVNASIAKSEELTKPAGSEPPQGSLRRVDSLEGAARKT